MSEPRPNVDRYGVPSHIDALRSLTDDELETAIRASSHTIQGGDILDEAARRRAERQAETLVRLTWTIVALTAAVALLTVVLLVRG